MEDMAYKLAIEVITIFVGIVGSACLVQLRAFLKKHNKQKALQVLNYVSDRMVQLVEVEFAGQGGEIKKNAALGYIVKALAARGIKMDEAEILADIEDGYNKLKSMQVTNSVLLSAEPLHE